MEGSSDDALPPRYAAGLRVPNMLQASPQQTGEVYKLHIPLVFSVLPKWMQKWMLRFQFFAMLGLLPSWQPRFLILLGRFLYKFSSRSNPHAPPKGRPLPVESADFHSIAEADFTFDVNSVSLENRPPGFRHVIVCSTLRKTHYYAVATLEDARAWIQSLQQAREEAIKRSMGHAPEGSYPTKWSYFDSLGENLLKSKERIEQRMRDGEKRELEMTSMGIGGPASPAGIYS